MVLGRLCLKDSAQEPAVEWFQVEKTNRFSTYSSSCLCIFFHGFWLCLVSLPACLGASRDVWSMVLIWKGESLGSGPHLGINSKQMRLSGYPNIPGLGDLLSALLFNCRVIQKKYATGKPDQKDLNENLAAAQGLAHMITECNRLFEVSEVLDLVTGRE